MQCSIVRLQSALAGHLPADEETALHQHLDACDECSTALEGMAGGPAWCREASSLLSEDEFDDSLPSREEWSEIDFTVEHLEPSDEPGVLGRLGGYDVLEIIGHGGMGVVLKAYDRELKRTVAIKVLAPHLARNSLARKRFAREAQAAAAVVHPHVLAIHQVQAGGRLPFLVMPLVPGESLAERLAARGTLELNEILRIGMQAAAGLAAAHEQGLVHRDVKPANILLERGVERAVLTDFGLARAADDVTLTRWGVVAGTPQYMSPEQARGEPLDGRSDLFSLGCVLYEMATGVSPFRTDSPLATMRRLVDDSPQPIDAINPELPPWFVAIVHRLLEKDPSRRFQSAAEVSELLETCLAHVQHPAAVPLPDGLPSAHQPHRASGRFASRVPRKLLIGAALALPLLMAGVVIVLEINKGMLTIESEADDVAVRITEGDEVVEKLTVTRGKNDVRIAAGQYVVEIDGQHDAIAVEDGNVTIERGGTQIVKVIRDERDYKATQNGTARSAEDIAKQLASRIEELKGKYPHFEKFSASKHLTKNREQAGIAPGTTLNPDLYWIHYRHNARSSSGPGPWTNIYDPETGIQLDIHLGKGHSRSDDLNPAYRIGELRVHVVVDGPAANAIRAEIVRFLEELGAERVAISADHAAGRIAKQVAARLEELKSKYPHLENFSVAQHLSKREGDDPGAFPRLYSIHYQNGVAEVPTLGRRLSPKYTYDPKTGIQLDIYFFKGNIRGTAAAPAYQIGDLGVSVYLRGPAAEAIRGEIVRLLEELGGKRAANSGDVSVDGDPEGEQPRFDPTVPHATDDSTFHAFLAEEEQWHGKAYPMAKRRGWWQRWLPQLLHELQETKDPDRRRSIASSAIGIANALEEFKTSEILVQELVKLSRSPEEGARWQAELDGLHERSHADLTTDVEWVAQEVATRIERLKSKYPPLAEFSSSSLVKNAVRDGFAPGTPSNPELYSISYSNGVLATEPPPKSGPRRSPRITFDPPAGIQLNIHFFKGDSRGSDRSPSYRISDWGVHVYVRGPAAEPIRREIDRLLKELGASLGPWTPAIEPPAPGPAPTLPPQPSDADRRTDEPIGPTSPTRPDPFPVITPNPADAIDPAMTQEFHDLASQEVHHLVWGETKNGLQAGIAFLGTEKRVYAIGESVPLAVRLRNVSSEPKSIKYTSARLRFAQPQIEGPKGERVQVIMPPRVRYVFPTIETSLKPGQEITFAVVQLQLAAEKPTQVSTPNIVASPGQYRITYTVPLMGRDQRDWPVTGTFRFEVADKKADSKALGFSEPREFVLSMNSMHYMLDLDTGKTMDPPATVGRPEIAQMDVHATQMQPYQLPTGLSGAPSFFIPGQPMRGMKVKSSQWNASAAEVRRALAGDDVPPLTEMEYKPLEPATYFFKTEAGADGILELMALVEEPKGIRIRYKTITSEGTKEAKKSSRTAADKLQTSDLFELRLASRQPTDGWTEAAVADTEEIIYVSNKPVATSADVSSAEAIEDPAGQPALQITFDAEAATRLGHATDLYRGQLLAIVVEGRVLAAPVIRDPITTKAVMVGNLSSAETKRLAELLTVTPRRMNRFETDHAIKKIALSPNGALIAIANGNPVRILQTDGASRVENNWKPSVEILDSRTGDRVASLKLTTVQEETALADTPRVSHIEATALAFSPNGSLLAVGTSHGQVKLFNTRNGEAHHVFDDREARLADKETPESWNSVPRAIGSVRSLAYSPDGKLLAVCGESFAEFSDVFDGVERLGRATTGPGRLKVWSVETGTLKHDLAGHGHAYGVAFSADGNTLASVGRWEDKGSGNGVLVWDPQTGAKLRTIQIEANGGTHYVDFSPNKKQIVTGSEIYDKENDTSSTSIAVTYPLSGITEWAQIVPGWSKSAFAPDGQSVVVLCGNESIRVLNAETGQLQQEMKAVDSIPGGKWNDFAIGPQGSKLILAGVTAERRGIVEIREVDARQATPR